jgi:hypothetical protein
MQSKTIKTIFSMSKYNNIKTKGYDSKKEYNRSLVLKAMQKAWMIRNLQEQVRFTLQESFAVKEGKKSVKIRKIEYVADFTYEQNWIQYIEDVKGVKTDVYKIKRKLFLYKYPHLSFVET